MCNPGECYVCGRLVANAHPFYDQLCKECGEFNWTKRHSSADLSGYTALVTGGRLKIGFETAVRLLRWGARVIVTTRFVNDARARFSRQPDAKLWDERLSILAADFRVPVLVEELVRSIREEGNQIDILINNAAQTVRKPPVFYRHLIEADDISKGLAHQDELLTAPRHMLCGRHDSAEMQNPRQELVKNAHEIALLSQIQLHPDDSESDPKSFPYGCLDEDGQQEDGRSFNSWMMKLDEVHLIELLEVLYINIVAPFLLCRGLRSVMRKETGERPSFIVNVTAMEGNFYNPQKNWRHPHTNIAKAALNMMTRTSASDFREDRIFMTSVDPGWITDEKPQSFHGFPSASKRKMAIDQIDGAARVCDPVFLAVKEANYAFGVLFKNYKPYPW